MDHYLSRGWGTKSLCKWKILARDIQLLSFDLLIFVYISNNYFFGYGIKENLIVE